MFDIDNTDSQPLRLYDIYEQVREEGWVNITEESLCLKQRNAIATTIHPLSHRSATDNPSCIFVELLRGVIDNILELTNHRISQLQPKTGRKKDLFTRRDVILFIAMIVDVQSQRLHTLKDYLNSKSRVGLPRARYDKLRKHLNFDLKHVIAAFNNGLEQTIQARIFSLNQTSQISV